MYEVISDLFGTYSPVTTLISGSVEEGTAQYAVSPDYTYIAGVLLFAIGVYSVFRCIGIVLNWGCK